jgi:hypothetical protein
MSLKLENKKDAIFKLVSYRTNTPDGPMYVQIMEDDNHNFVGINLHIGKAGSSLRAYLNVISRFITLLVENGVSIYNIIEELSNQRSDRSVFLANGKEVSSAMEALFFIMTSYNSEKIANEENGKHKKVGYFTKRKRA